MRIAGHRARRERRPWNSTPRNIHSSESPTSIVFRVTNSRVLAGGSPGGVTHQNTANLALQPFLTHTLLPSTPHERPYVHGLPLSCL